MSMKEKEVVNLAEFYSLIFATSLHFLKSLKQGS